MKMTRFLFAVLPWLPSAVGQTWTPSPWPISYLRAAALMDCYSVLALTCGNSVYTQGSEECGGILSSLPTLLSSPRWIAVLVPESSLGNLKVPEEVMKSKL